jgi:hypothetical protein
MPFWVKSAQSIIISGLIGSALVLAQNAPWGKEPESFKGARFLASESEVRSTIRLPSPCVSRDYNEKTCFFFFNVASAEIVSVAIFQRDALVDVNGVFSQADFSTVLDVFTEAYGASSRTSVQLFSGGDQYRWSGKSVSIRLERSISDERRGNVKAIISSFCEAQRAAVRNIDAFSQNLYKQADADRQRSGVGIAARADAMVRSLEEQEAEHEKNVSYAESQCQKFSSRTYGLFSITLNNYAAQVEKRKEEEKSKAADSLK